MHIYYRVMVEAHIEAEKYNLFRNDSMYFDLSVPRYYKNTGTGEARLVCVIACQYYKNFD